MKSDFGKTIRLGKEGIFLLSMPLIVLAFFFIKPEQPFEIVTASLLLFLITPFLIARFILNENIYFLGFRRGEVLRGVSGIIIGWLIFFPFLYLLSTQKEFQAIYPPFAQMRQNIPNLILMEIGIMLIAFIGVQTFIFGYVYEGIRRMVGNYKAVLLLSFVVIPLFYLGRPIMEIILAMFVGVVTCWIKKRSHSILYAIVFGWGLSFILDALVIYNLYLGK